MSAEVKTTGGSKVTSGKVAFKINGKTIGKTTVSNGKATLSYKIGSSWSNAENTITVVYGENSKYYSSSDKSTLTVLNVSKTVAKVSSITTYAGKTVTLKSTVKTSGGSNVNTGKVAFKINGKTIGKANVKNGAATLSYKVPSTWNNAKYTITVVYGQNGVYKSSKGYGLLELNNVSKTVTKVSAISTTGGSTVTLKATVKTSGGSNVNTGKVAFKINGKTIGKANVKNGVATLSYKVPSSWNGESKTISVVYGQSGVYKASSGKNTLNVEYSIPSSLKKYLVSSKNCDITNSVIQKLAKSFNSTYSNTLKKAKAIFNDLNKKLDYRGYYNTKYGAVKTIQRGYGNCVDMAHAIIAVARACGIPARYCHAKCTFRSGLVTGHVWAELYVNGKWYSCDLTSSSNTFGNIVNWRKSTTVKRYASLSF